MRFRFLINEKDRGSAWTIGTTVYINLAAITTNTELIDGLKHESFHSILNQIEIRSSEKQDHWIMKRLFLG
jgi:predicted metal-dependent peptidase